MNAVEGLQTIKSLEQNFAGGGVNSSNIAKILTTTKVTNIHCSASKKILRHYSSTAFPSKSLEIKISQIDEMSAIKSQLV